MPGLFVLSDASQSFEEAERYAGDELLVLVVIDKNTLATSFDNAMDAIEARAKELRQRVESKGVKCRTLVEWGDKTEAVSNALIRENASLLNKF